MLKKLQIINFQSHENTTLDFHNGVNSIVGKTDSGKSSILRALHWVLFNIPSGDSFKRHNTDETTVILTLDDGNVITRIKGKENLYKLNATVFKAFGSKVPIEIQKVLNFKTVNFQNQFDSHFLLSDSAGIVASHFNIIANLEVIEIAEQNIKSAVRKIKNDINTKLDLKKSMQKNLKKFAYLKSFEKDLVVVEELETKYEQDFNNEFLLTSLLANIISVKTSIINESKLLPLEKELNELIVLIDEKEDIKVDIDALSGLLTSIDIIEVTISKKQKLVKLEKQVTNLIAIFNSHAILTTNFKRLQQLYTNITLNKKSALKHTKNTLQLQKRFEKNIGNICPLCGTKLKNK